MCEAVRLGGATAVRDITREFDGVILESVRVPARRSLTPSAHSTARCGRRSEEASAGPDECTRRNAARTQSLRWSPAGW